MYMYSPLCLTKTALDVWMIVGSFFIIFAPFPDWAYCGFHVSLNTHKTPALLTGVGRLE